MIAYLADLINLNPKITMGKAKELLKICYQALKRLRNWRYWEPIGDSVKSRKNG